MEKRILTSTNYNEFRKDLKSLSHKDNEIKEKEVWVDKILMHTCKNSGLYSYTIGSNGALFGGEALAEILNISYRDNSESLEKIVNIKKEGNNGNS